VRPWLDSLGLARCPPFQRDPLFLGALAAGLLFWLALGFAVPLAGRLAPPMALLSVLLWQPVLEELLFRGAIQGELLTTPWGTRRLGPVSAANALTSVAFCALHFMHHAPLWALSVLAPSLLFGLLRERHDSVWPALALHIYYNSGYFLLFGVT